MDARSPETDAIQIQAQRIQAQRIERLIRRVLQVKRMQGQKKASETQKNFIKARLEHELVQENKHYNKKRDEFIEKRNAAVDNLNAELKKAEDENKIEAAQANKIRNLIKDLSFIQQASVLKAESLLSLQSLVASADEFEKSMGNSIHALVEKFNQSVADLDARENKIKDRLPVFDMEKASKENNHNNPYCRLKMFLELCVDQNQIDNLFGVIGVSAGNILQNGNFDSYAQVIELLIDTIEIVGTGDENEPPLTVTSFDEEKAEKLWGQLALVKSLTKSVAASHDVVHNYGLVQKILKNLKTEGHWLTDDEIRLFINTYAPKQPIHLCVKTSEAIKDAVIQERNKHKDGEAYTFYLMLNSAGSVFSQGSHWTSAKVIVEADKTIRIEYADSSRFCWSVDKELIKGVSAVFSKPDYKIKPRMQEHVVTQKSYWECGYASLYHIFRHLNIDSPIVDWTSEQGFYALAVIIQKAILLACRFRVDNKNFKDGEIHTLCDAAGDSEPDLFKFKESTIEEKFVARKKPEPSLGKNEGNGLAESSQQQTNADSAAQTQQGNENQAGNAAANQQQEGAAKADAAANNANNAEANNQKNNTGKNNHESSKRQLGGLPEGMPFHRLVTECKDRLDKYHKSRSSDKYVSFEYDVRLRWVRDIIHKLKTSRHDRDLALILQEINQYQKELICTYPTSGLIAIFESMQAGIEALLNPRFSKETDDNPQVLYDRIFNHLKSVDTDRVIKTNQYSSFGRELLFNGCKGDRALANTGQHTLKDELIGKLYFIKINLDMDPSTKCAEMRRVMDQSLSEIGNSRYGKPTVLGDGSRLLRALSFFETKVPDAYNKPESNPVQDYIGKCGDFWRDGCHAAAIELSAATEPKVTVRVDGNGNPDPSLSEKIKNRIYVEAALHLLRTYQKEWGTNHRQLVTEAVSHFEARKADLTVNDILQRISADLRKKMGTGNAKNWAAVNPDGKLMQRLNFIAATTGNKLDICMGADAPAPKSAKTMYRK